MDALSDPARENILTRRANQRHYSIITQFVKRPWPSPTTGSSARLQAENPYRQLKLRRLAMANDRLRVAEPRALYDTRARGDIDVNPVPDLNKATAIAATGQAKAAAAPRVKFLSHG